MEQWNLGYWLPKGKPLLTKGKTFVIIGKDLGDQRETLGDQREILGDKWNWKKRKVCHIDNAFSYSGNITKRKRLDISPTTCLQGLEQRKAPALPPPFF